MTESAIGRFDGVSYGEMIRAIDEMTDEEYDEYMRKNLEEGDIEAEANTVFYTSEEVYAHMKAIIEAAYVSR